MVYHGRFILIVNFDKNVIKNGQLLTSESVFKVPLEVPF